MFLGAQKSFSLASLQKPPSGSFIFKSAGYAQPQYFQTLLFLTLYYNKYYMKYLTFQIWFNVDCVSLIFKVTLQKLLFS